MWTWLRRREPKPRLEPAADTSLIERRAGMPSGKYLALFKYLEHRYADITVLTFEQIEDLLGFALPPLARTNLSWWTIAGAHVDVQPHAAAWIAAGRTATPNLQARNVVFERTAKARQGPK